MALVFGAYLPYRTLFTILLVCIACPIQAIAHDIPNARVDRSTQVRLWPGRVEIDYEVSLSELTLTRELRSLIGTLPGADRSDWLTAYGRETGPLNAKGFLVRVDGESVVLKPVGFEVKVEEHPIYRFHFRAEVSKSGRLTLRDTNFESSEGTSRLALRGTGVTIQGSDLPTEVASIIPRPLWQLSDAEERRTRAFQVDYAVAKGASGTQSPNTGVSRPMNPSRPTGTGMVRLTGLFDNGSGLSKVLVGLLAFALGAVHALQPGHGKTLVLATAVDRGGWARVATLALITTVVHTSSVFLVALLLWWTTSERFGELHVTLTRAAGYVIASVGFWRLGRILAGLPEDPIPVRAAGSSRQGGLLALGIAGGLVPCWDAVGLVIMGEAVGRLGMALGLVVAFSVGLGVSLAAVGLLALRFRRFVVRDDGAEVWSRRLRMAGGLALALMGVWLLALPS